jgi:purine-nucleoside phosphorylase
MSFLTQHKQTNEPSVFTPENLLREARRQKKMQECNVPQVCVLDPDGDLVEYLIEKNQVTLNTCWACYHTKLYTTRQNGYEFGIVGTAVGSSFAVLVAEQLFVSGCEILISVTSAGIINRPKKESRFVLIKEALRDEGTSYHYLPREDVAGIDLQLQNRLEDYFNRNPFPIETGDSWTTDAPYRETQSAIEKTKALGVTCVEMEAAALYAFARAKNKKVVCFAHLTNTMAQTEGDFEKGAFMGSLDTLQLLHHVIKTLFK